MRVQTNIRSNQSPSTRRVDYSLTLPNGNKAYFDSGSLVAVVVPEPGTALLGLAGSLLLMRRRRA